MYTKFSFVSSAFLFDTSIIKKTHDDRQTLFFLLLGNFMILIQKKYLGFPKYC